MRSALTPRLVSTLHAEGMTDRQIRDHLAVPGDAARQRIRRVRLSLGLPANRETPPAVDARRQSIRATLDRLGVGSLAEVKARSEADFASAYGLPFDLRPIQIRIILALLAGPMTLPEIAGAIGAKPGSHLVYTAANTTYQADLVRRGLLAKIPTEICTVTRRARCRYMLTTVCLDSLTKGGAK